MKSCQNRILVDQPEILFGVKISINRKNPANKLAFYLIKFDKSIKNKLIISTHFISGLRSLNRKIFNYPKRSGEQDVKKAQTYFALLNSIPNICSITVFKSLIKVRMKSSLFCVYYSLLNNMLYNVKTNCNFY